MLPKPDVVRFTHLPTRLIPWYTCCNAQHCRPERHKPFRKETQLRDNQSIGTMGVYIEMAKGVPCSPPLCVNYHGTLGTSKMERSAALLTACAFVISKNSHL